MTTPRTLELYAGRAGWSAHQKAMGNHAFFLDWNRECVQKSFDKAPEYDPEGQVGRARARMPRCAAQPHERTAARAHSRASAQPSEYAAAHRT